MNKNNANRKVGRIFGCVLIVIGVSQWIYAAYEWGLARGYNVGYEYGLADGNRILHRKLVKETTNK